jgi:hypothetical protein
MGRAYVKFQIKMQFHVQKRQAYIKFQTTIKSHVQTVQAYVKSQTKKKLSPLKSVRPMWSLALNQEARLI